MMEECFKRLIERPSGISGYRPAFWCAVCGRTGSQQTVWRCSMEGCSNVCHERCLGNAAEYKCGDTGQLRAALGIDDPVIPYTHDTPAAPTPPAFVDTTEEGLEDDLASLPKVELAQLVRSLRNELASAKSHLTNYRFITGDLADKRRVLVEALSIVDTLIATHDYEDLQQRSVACSARPKNIDAEVTPVAPGEINQAPPTDLPHHSHPSSHFTVSPTQPLISTSSPSGALPLSSPAPLQPHTPTLPPQHPSSPSSFLTLSSPPPLQSNLPPTLPLERASSPIGPSPLSSVAPFQPSLPPAFRHQHCSTTSSSPPHSKPALDEAPLSQMANVAFRPSVDTDPEWQRRPHQGPHPSLRKNKLQSGGKVNSREDASGPRLQPRLGTNLRRQQTKCPKCKRFGHTRDMCPREASCDYCQGRFHSSSTCRTKLADQRQQELVQAVRQSGQETLLALKSLASHLHQPLSGQAPRPTLAAPPGLPVPQAPWPVPLPAQHALYGAGTYQPTALRHPGLQ